MKQFEVIVMQTMKMIYWIDADDYDDAVDKSEHLVESNEYLETDCDIDITEVRVWKVYERKESP